MGVWHVYMGVMAWEVMACNMGVMACIYGSNGMYIWE